MIIHIIINISINIKYIKKFPYYQDLFYLKFLVKLKINLTLIGTRKMEILQKEPKNDFT